VILYPLSHEGVIKCPYRTVRLADGEIYGNFIVSLFGKNKTTNLSGGETLVYSLQSTVYEPA